jgi:ribonuclease BN (tRNA processing enzyme)
VLGPYGGSAPGHRMTTFLLNDVTALDAGAITAVLSLAEQRRIRRVFITHSHLDHVATLPFFVENVFGRPEPVEIIAPQPVLTSLQRHLFSGDLWPDFSRLPSRREASVRLRPIAEGTTLRVDGLSFTPVRVNHVVPTYGYLVSTPRASILFSGDTAPTENLWKLADRARNLKAIFLEVSFSDELAAVAAASRHLTPALLEPELAKTRQDVPVFLYHMKPPSVSRIEREVRALRNPRLRFLHDDERLAF